MSAAELGSFVRSDNLLRIIRQVGQPIEDPYGGIKLANRFADDCTEPGVIDLAFFKMEKKVSLPDGVHIAEARCRLSVSLECCLDVAGDPPLGAQPGVGILHVSHSLRPTSRARQRFRDTPGGNPR